MHRLLALTVALCSLAACKKDSPQPEPAPPAIVDKAPVPPPKPPVAVPVPPVAVPVPPAKQPGDDEVAAAKRIVEKVGPVLIDTRDSCVDGPPKVDKAIADVKAEVDLVAKGWKDPAIAARLKTLLNDATTPTGKANELAQGAAMHCGVIAMHYMHALGLDRREAQR